MNLIKLRRRLLQLQLHYWRHVYGLIRLWFCACINKSNGSQFKSSTLWQCFHFCIYASDLVIFFFSPWGCLLIHSFLLSCSFWSWRLLSHAEQRQLNLDLLQNCWDILCAWNPFTHRKHFILCMDFRIHYTLQVLWVTVASEWSLCVCTEYNTVKNHSRTCKGWRCDNRFSIAYGILWM